MKSDLHDIKVIYQHHTDRAVCIRETEGGPDIWIPLATCEVEPDLADTFRRPQRGDIVTLTAPERVLNEKGLI
jgi:hypothetical protein